ncbi:MAG: UDP-N-acetylmuramate--L-alanine ligase [Candidatus Paceibacterota bacterium]
MELLRAQKIHCIGIGGIGVSALAQMFARRGVTVSGSDVAVSPITAQLKKYGAKIFIGHRAQNIPRDCDAVIYTKAITSDNIELIEAHTRGMPTFSYSQALGMVSDSAYTIAVAGSHGKTTTTGMIGWTLLHAKKDPTIVIGSFLSGAKSNFVAGAGPHFVVEACEYQKSFLDIHPTIAVVTNIDNDHLDYYKTKANLFRGFVQFISQIPRSGFLVCDLTDPVLKRLAKEARCRVVDCSKEKINFSLPVIGKHNVHNAQAAAAALRVIGLSSSAIKDGLASFAGTWRRQEYKGSKNGVLVYDDYGHHPTEIKATLEAFADAFPGRRIVVVFQPHLYSRTKLLFKDFVKSFDGVTGAVIVPIYAAREKKDPTITSQMLVAALKKRGVATLYAASFETAAERIKKLARGGDIVLTMGAGNVFAIGDRFLKKMHRVKSVN